MWLGIYSKNVQKITDHKYLFTNFFYLYFCINFTSDVAGDSKKKKNAQKNEFYDCVCFMVF